MIATFRLKRNSEFATRNSLATVLFVFVLSVLSVLLIGQVAFPALKRDRTRASALPPPPVRARFGALHRLLRPDRAPLPVAYLDAGEAVWAASSDIVVLRGTRVPGSGIRGRPGREKT